ncbi:DEP domain-containing protein [Mycena indigotica]|uniref:Vacuolar membrane-associated protein IML1 n=1 Tax=Mycena indigotica TaxID=2126181 RepID=A0A8H6SIG9_9AGAR|nr:DEP domain-containing protein [Mycena indigotica]KAF7298947.1 DEP domain-containing protein [Mycena indigotica]
MSATRGESQPAYGRRRSNTIQSIRPVPPAPPLVVGDTQVLNSWVHDLTTSRGITFNHAAWPGVREGDMLSAVSAHGGSEPFLFFVPKDEGSSRSQISIPKPIADTFKLKNNTEVLVTKVDPTIHAADYVEMIFQDQYLGRSDMWRLGEYLVDQCVYVNQDVAFIGGIAAKIHAIYIGGKKVSAACVTTATKTIFRSLSAKVTIFIQVCRELWEFAGDGERYNEKIVHSFLPALFAKWREANTNHTVTIVLISRVYYDETEITYAAGPLQCDEGGCWYKDFYKVITDLEVIHEWKPTLVSLKTSFWDFQRDILLTHHYHRASQDGSTGVAPEQVRLVGRLSYAHDGPLLEALNMALTPTETHYIDRSLSLTGAATIVITPGTGYYRVSKRLLRLTTTRMLDQGFGLDLICLAKHPLHQSPIFSFRGPEVGPSERNKDGTGATGRAADPLWGGDDEITESTHNIREYWWEPFWVFVSFWDQQMDLPFRKDRFIARAKMHEIQMLGLLEHDVVSGIEVPFLPLSNTTTGSPLWDGDSPPAITKPEADQFDLNIFALKPESKALTAPSLYRDPWFSVTPGSTQRIAEKRMPHRSTRLGTGGITEVSPKTVHRELPPEKSVDGTSVVSAVAPSGGLSKSPSQSSLRSIRSSQSSTSIKAIKRTGSVASKLAPSWLFNPFRSTPSEPQTSSVSASASASISGIISFSSSVTLVSSPAATISRAPVPIRASHDQSKSQSGGRTLEDDSLTPHRTSFTRKSPLNTPPRDEASFGKRRSVLVPLSTSSSFPSSSTVPTNPSRLESNVTYTQSTLARRWEHIFPEPLFKHDIKWSSIVTPACLPLTVSYFPSAHELETSYDMFSYDFVLDPAEMHSFMVKRTQQPKKGAATEAMRREWALVVMRGMAAVRLAQGFQFILRDPSKSNTSGLESHGHSSNPLRRGKSFVEDEKPRPKGAADVLRSALDSPVYLCMSNEIHRIAYASQDETIQVRRYVRRMPQTRPFSYECLIWPKLGGGYTEQKTVFNSHGLENYGWNSLDMLIIGYGHQFNESLRYWRTRFVVIPTFDPPSTDLGPSDEQLNEEETRILGIEKLAEQFTKLRWQSPDEEPAPNVRFLLTTLNPAVSVLDEALMEQLDQIHTAGPLKKNMKSEKEISEMSLAAVAKAMRSDGGVPIKHYVWHKTQYPNSFTGHDVVSWLVREFRDISSRAQATEWGIKLEEQGLFEHCRGNHNFLDGQYFYRFKGEYAVPVTPRGWFGSRRLIGSIDPRASGTVPPTPSANSRNFSPRQNKRRLILSQSMVIDIDPNKRSDQAESVILHHDLIHNPGTVFHFELQWIGTTARCIEDQLRQWSRTIERYGLKLVEAYVTQISDIRERNAFQSCFPLRLAVAPPVVPDLEKRVPLGTHTDQYFEYALLRRFDFIVDIEAAKLYPPQVDVVYSYRRSPFDYSQFVHRSGVAFVQVLGGERGFLFLTNRLMAPGRMGTTSKSKEHQPAAAADNIRVALQNFCSDEQGLRAFYEEEMALLGPIPEEPPPLSI